MKPWRRLFSHNLHASTYSSGLTSELMIVAPAKAVGRLIVEDDLFIDSTYQGDIESKGQVRIGPNAHLKGNLKARTVALQGQFEGSISSSENLVLGASSDLKNAQLQTNNLVIHAGARLNDVKITTIS